MPRWEGHPDPRALIRGIYLSLPWRRSHLPRGTARAVAAGPGRDGANRARVLAGLDAGRQSYGSETRSITIRRPATSTSGGARSRSAGPLGAPPGRTPGRWRLEAPGRPSCPTPTSGRRLDPRAGRDIGPRWPPRTRPRRAPVPSGCASARPCRAASSPCASSAPASRRFPPLLVSANRAPSTRMTGQGTGSTATGADSTGSEPGKGPRGTRGWPGGRRSGGERASSLAGYLAPHGGGPVAALPAPDLAPAPPR